MKYFKKYNSFNEAYSNVSIDYIKTLDKLWDYDDSNGKKILNKFTIINIPYDEYVKKTYDLLGKVIAFDNEDGTEIGNATYGYNKERSGLDLIASVDVREDKRRQGVASEMYLFIEELTGLKLHPDLPHSNLASELWKSKNRKFGL